MLNQQSEKKFFESMDAAEASAARAFIGEDACIEDDFQAEQEETPEDIAQEALDRYHAEQDMQALDDDIEAKMQRKIDSQADQNYWAQCAAEGYNPHDHDRDCDCPECCSDEPPPEQVAEQDCPHCPKGDNGHHQYQIKSGCFVEGKPSCEWCARTEEVWQDWETSRKLPTEEEALEPSEEERAALLEPTPYDAGICQGCGEHIAAGMLHAHECVSEDEDEDDCDHTCNCVCPLCLG